MSLRRFFLTSIIALAAAFSLSAQENGSQKDSLVRLLSAKSMQLIEENGVNYRKVTGPAKFLHNDTYLLCDTALWNVRTNEIFAIDHVKILQDQTVLTSDRLTYYVDRDLAQFRGALVQLEDKDHNILRTENLDYNTRDSVAVFFGGGSMKDKDGQIIESISGTYDSKLKEFTFTDDVNMFTDSIFVKTTRILYDAGRNIAHFGFDTNAWKEENMLSSNAGWYDRNTETFLFNRDVHGMNDVQEGWSDSLYFYRATGNFELLGNAQVTDTTRDVSAVAGRIHYADSLARILMTREPAVIGLVDSGNGVKDTVYFGADTIISRSVMAFQVDSIETVNAKARLEGLAVDAVQTYRQKAAKAAAEAAAKAAEEDPNRPQPGKGGPGKGLAGRGIADQESMKVPTDSLKVPADSLAGPSDSLALASDSLSISRDSLTLAADSLMIAADSLALASDSLSLASDSLAVQADTVVRDSTKYNFVTAVGRVKLYKSDMQIACDSLAYCDLDSLVRLYREPLIWNEVNRQYAADSVYAVIKNSSLEKASLMSNAFIIVQEDSLCYDQIKATEMLAYFDSTGVLRRFDALGDASAIFYLQEDSVYATVNKSSAKMLHAIFTEGNLDRVYYFEDTKNDAYPLAQMKKEERVLKGFNWLPDKRPKGKSDITPYELRPSERGKYSSIPRTSFKYTDRFFPGYMQNIYKEIREAKLMRELERQRAEQDKKNAALQQPQDSIMNVGDSLSLDSLKVAGDSLKMAGDSLSVALDSTVQAKDSLAVAADSIAASKPMDPEAIKAAEKAAAKAEKAAAKAARIAEKEAKWARLDSLDQAKDSLKAEKKAAKLREKKRKALLVMYKQQKKDNAKLERYKEIYMKKKSRSDKRDSNRKPLKKDVVSEAVTKPVKSEFIVAPE
ncbi:MAG: OstA-like protein, partial [Candidatus Cryptobacteroides sp.]|nr:OstA-like protein [Candidatus Cryptobacteroides sp.]